MIGLSYYSPLIIRNKKTLVYFSWHLAVPPECYESMNKFVEHIIKWKNGYIMKMLNIERKLWNDFGTLISLFEKEQKNIK